MSASLVRWGVVGALVLSSGWWALRTGAPGPLANAVDSAAAFGLPPLERPAEVAPSAPRIAVGSKLFFDRRLSFNGSMSSAMCLVPEQGFTSHDSRTGIGIEGKSLTRNAPSLLNVAWQARLFHDGRESSLVTQAWLPFLHPDEIANPSIGHMLDRLFEGNQPTNWHGIPVCELLTHDTRTGPVFAWMLAEWTADGRHGSQDPARSRMQP